MRGPYLNSCPGCRPASRCLGWMTISPAPAIGIWRSASADREVTLDRLAGSLAAVYRPPES
jgi:hypothetical protein